MRGAGQEESADEIAKWSGAESEGSETEEDATTAGGVGWERATRTARVWGAQESGEGDISGDAMAGGEDTGKASPAAANEAGAGATMG